MRAVSARVKNPNTPESDLQERVVHAVTMSNGTVRYVMAVCPIDAIERVNKVIENARRNS